MASLDDHRKAIDAIRRIRGRPSNVGLDGLAASREPSQPAHELPDDGLWLQVRALPGKQRTAVVHRFVMDRDYRSIGELMGTSEEAEVRKEARVVGEVALTKESKERQQTVKDTVRRTDVEVEVEGSSRKRK